MNDAMTKDDVREIITGLSTKRLDESCGRFTRDDDDPIVIDVAWDPIHQHYVIWVLLLQEGKEERTVAAWSTVNSGTVTVQIHRWLGSGQVFVGPVDAQYANPVRAMARLHALARGEE